MNTFRISRPQPCSSIRFSGSCNPPSLIRVFTVRMKKAWVLSYPLSAQRRLWSDWADAQADLSLRWAHFVGFVMMRLKWVPSKSYLIKTINTVSILPLTIVQWSRLICHILQCLPKTFKTVLAELYACKINMPCQAYSLTTVGLNPTLISCENIRIYHDCLVWIENSVPRVTVRQKWCQTVILRDRVFYPHQTVLVDSFLSTPFQFLLLFVILNVKHSPTF